MTATLPRPIEKVTARVHRWLYRRTKGRRGATVGTNRRPVALLTTTGRRTGLARTWPVIYLEDADRIVAVASNAGRDHDPAWYLNLLANPECRLQLGPATFESVARVATAQERAQLWPRLHDLHRGYADYARKTDRDLPIVVFEALAPIG